ncbi:MAG: hypothetical protein ABSH56_22065, partial [Bryobacteraceae bacterium]
VFADPEAGEHPHLDDSYPDTYAIRHIGLDRYVEAYRVYPQPRSEDITRHAQGIAWKLQGCDPSAKVMIVVSLNLLDAVLDAMEEPQAQPLARIRREGIELLNPHPDSLAEIAAEYPALQWRYETFRGGDQADPNLIDRRHAQLALFRDAAKEYEAQTGETIAHWQRRLLARYTRNLALVANQLSAGVFDLTVAARGVADDNYACLSGAAHGAHLGRGHVARYPPHTAPPPPPQHQTPPSPLRSQTPPEGKISRRVGQPVERRQHLLLSARRPGHRRLRPISQVEGQKHPFRRARPRRAIHHLHSRRHRHA